MNHTRGTRVQGDSCGNELSLCKREDISHVLDSFDAFKDADFTHGKPVIEDSETGEIISPQTQNHISQTARIPALDTHVKFRDVETKHPISESQNQNICINIHQSTLRHFVTASTPEKQPDICETRTETMFHINDFPSNILIQILKRIV